MESDGRVLVRKNIRNERRYEVEIENTTEKVSDNIRDGQRYEVFVNTVRTKIIVVHDKEE